MTGVKEGLLRRLAHVVLFAALAVTAGLTWGWYGVGAVFVWALLDEVTKIPIRGRHFSWLDVGLNLGGAALGMVLWLLV
jgi:VanZ family protein